MKFWADYIKHLTTLSTGSVLLISTFLEQFFTRPLWKPCVAVALSAFLLSVIGAIIAYTSMAWVSIRWDDDPTEHWGNTSAGNVASGGLYVAWIGFLTGIISFAAFAIRNLL